MEIKFALSPAERLAVFQFRYAVIVQEMGVAIPAANHLDKTVRDPEDETGHLFCAFVGGKLVGSARMNVLSVGQVSPHCELLRLSELPCHDGMSVCSRFLVATEYRGSLLAIRVMRAMFRFMRESQIVYDFILVKNDLVQLYERIGYQRYGDAVTHPEIGDAIPLRLGIFDDEYLRSIRSPLLPCLETRSKGERQGSDMSATAPQPAASP